MGSRAQGAGHRHVERVRERQRVNTFGVCDSCHVFFYHMREYNFERVLSQMPVMGCERYYAPTLGRPVQPAGARPSCVFVGACVGAVRGLRRAATGETWGRADPPGCRDLYAAGAPGAAGPAGGYGSTVGIRGPPRNFELKYEISTRRVLRARTLHGKNSRRGGASSRASRTQVHLVSTAVLSVALERGTLGMCGGARPTGGCIRGGRCASKAALEQPAKAGSCPSRSSR